jgi:outer membrane protein OmpA-like peptidoglycan-associated protein
MKALRKSLTRKYSPLLFLPGFSILAFPAQAQLEQVVQVPVGVVKKVVRTVDREILQRQLSLPPRVVVVETREPSPAVESVTVVETTQPRRVYNTERNVVIIEEQGQTRELTYVTLPVLFEVETNDLLDQESRVALEEVAKAIVAISQESPGTQFEIEGHTSTEGTDQYNMDLSAARAKRVYDELTQRYNIPPSLLSANGYGENFPSFPNGTEDEKQLDRRVLVVRTK